MNLELRDKLIHWIIGLAAVGITAVIVSLITQHEAVIAYISEITALSVQVIVQFAALAIGIGIMVSSFRR